MDLQSLKIERKPPAAVARRSPWPFRLFLVAALAAAGWLFWPMASTWIDGLRLPKVRVEMVTAAPPATAAAATGTAANGYLVAARRAALSSDVPGRIVELAVREGSVVKRGDVVARLYADEYRAALGRAAADLATAEANVARATAQEVATKAITQEAESQLAALAAQRDEAAAAAAFARAELTRSEALQTTGIGSPRDVERARADALAADARLAAQTAAHAAGERALASARARTAVATADAVVAGAQRDAAAAARALAQATLDKTDVRAPFDGIVVLKDAEVGEVVSPNVQGGSNARGAVCTMVDFASLEVQANVPETSLASVQVGAPADVFLDAFPDQRYPGRVDRIWPTADRQKATVEVRVELLQRDDRLRPEMGVRIVFRDSAAATPGSTAGSAAPPTLLIRATAVVQKGTDQGVFVLDRDVVRWTAVTTASARNDRVAVTQGLSPGQLVVLDPPASLQDGDRVSRIPN